MIIDMTPLFVPFFWAAIATLAFGAMLFALGSR